MGRFCVFVLSPESFCNSALFSLVFWQDALFFVPFSYLSELRGLFQQNQGWWSLEQWKDKPSRLRWVLFRLCWVWIESTDLFKRYYFLSSEVFRVFLCCAFGPDWFRHKKHFVRVRKRSWFGLKYLLRSPQTHPEKFRGYFWPHKYNWKLSRGLLKRIHRCPARKCSNSTTPPKKYLAVFPQTLTNVETNKHYQHFILKTGPDSWWYELNWHRKLTSYFLKWPTHAYPYIRSGM